MFIFFITAAISVNRVILRALYFLGLHKVTRTIVPSSNSYTFIVQYDITQKIQYSRLITQMKSNKLQIIHNQKDRSILVTLDKPWFSVIWLHGLGDTSNGFLSYFQTKISPVYKGARVTLLQAPIRAVTINDGEECPSWFDYKQQKIQGTDEDNYSIPEVQNSLEIVDSHITDQLHYWREQGIKGDEQTICKRIFIGGFSQGCSLSLCYGLTSFRLLGGVVGFSGHLFDSFPLINKENLQMLVYHGTEDDVLSFEEVKDLYHKHLVGLPNFTFKLIKGMSHEVKMKYFSQSVDWMLEQLKKTGII